MRLQSQAPKTGFGALSPAAGVERPKLTRVLQFGEGAARKIAQFCNSEKARTRIAPHFHISDKGSKLAETSLKLVFTNEQNRQEV